MRRTHPTISQQITRDRLVAEARETRHLTTGQDHVTVASSMNEPILIKVERSTVGRSQYRYTGTFNDGSKQSILSRRFFQYGYADPEGALYFSKTKPTGPASSYVAITEAKKANKPMATKKAAKKATAKKAAKTAAKKTKRIDTGYVAAIRALLLKGKFTRAQAAAKIKEQFPDKDVESIKRIANNVAKRMRKAGQDVRWVPGAPPNTGYMARIDELLRSGKMTTRQIAEKVAEEFEKDVISAKKVVRARLKRLRDSGDKTVKPLLEADIREKKSKATTKAPKAKGKGKAPAKASKAKGKAKKTAKQAAPVEAAPVEQAPAETEPVAA